ncbi:hypothetical protein WJX73_009354 [Symbiochloris irregularis]|uniref:peptidylprolyl isomerase n=1 Tax=Symbiochloris irregularis TaxID=706552 RepID=A0AAW1NIT5_9CHLO
MVCPHRLPEAFNRASSPRPLLLTLAAHTRRRTRRSTPPCCTRNAASGGAKCSDRRDLLSGAAACAVLAGLQAPAVSAKEKYESMSALKGKDYGKARTRYPDYVLTDSGLQYQDIREGSGAAPQQGSQVVIDWDGYTIGYYGRPFEAKNKAKGGSFATTENRDYFRFELGANKVIPAFEEAVATMKPGGIRRIVVPVELGYPENDFNKAGPRPSTFSGQRALDFVLKNQGLIDKTLLFDIELVRVL